MFNLPFSGVQGDHRPARCGEAGDPRSWVGQARTSKSKGTRRCTSDKIQAGWV